MKHVGAPNVYPFRSSISHFEIFFYLDKVAQKVNISLLWDFISYFSHAVYRFDISTNTALHISAHSGVKLHIV